MPEALARAPRGPVLTAPVRDAPPRRKAKPAPAVWRQWLPTTAAGYAGAALVAALIGIMINAVGLQRERHPAPFFAGELAPPAAPAPIAQIPSPPPAAKPAAEVVPPLPVARPAPRTAAPAVHDDDPIGDLLHAKPAKDAKDAAPTIAAVQTALIRHGYTLKADGVMGGDTEDALRDFEKTHSLPQTTELTPKLLAKLNIPPR